MQSSGIGKTRSQEASKINPTYLGLGFRSLFLTVTRIIIETIPPAMMVMSQIGNPPRKSTFAVIFFLVRRMNRGTVIG